MAFFETLNFSSSNEDGETEIAALAGCRRILCVTGTGTRVLDLLIGDAEAIIALDANPVQNAALALKVAAITAFERPEYLGFIGIATDTNRLARYDGLRAQLTPDARAICDRLRTVIAHGLWTAGRWEKLLRWNARFLSLFRKTAIEALMSAPTIEAQHAIWQAKFAAGDLRAKMETLGRDIIWRLLMREPAASYLPSARIVGERLKKDFERASLSFLFRESDIATLVFRGRHSSDSALPVHLRAENYDRLRDRLPALRIAQGDLAALDRMDKAPFDGFSLSDFGSYCGADDYATCWQAIVASARPNARFCERIFMNEMPVPSDAVSIDMARSATLSAGDRSIIYRIRAGTIGRSG